MKALTGPSMYPGTTFNFSCRFLLCVLFLSSVHGNTYQQDAQRAWKNFSQILLSANTYPENERALLSSQNNSGKGPLLLDENNIMHREVFQTNNDDVTYSEEYNDQETHPPSGLKTMLRPTNLLSNASISDKVKDSSVIINPNNNISKALDGEQSYVDQYDTYYYYEDLENETISDDHHTEKFDNHTVSDEEKGNPKATEDSHSYSDSDNSTYHSTHYDNFSDSELYDTDDGASMESSNKHYVLTSNNSNKLPEKSILIGEAVVSVVTTKSVVNGTISIPVTPLPQTTEQISSPPSSSEFMDNKQMQRHQTTENSIVLASVQTSRSISGARFLPFPVVEQVVQVAPNVKTNTKVSGPVESTESIIDKLDRVQSELSSGISTKVSGPVESTESIIDKLDRVQSELSSGIFGGGFRNSGNTLQLDVLPEAEQSRKSRTTTMRTPVISKFTPHRYNASRKPITSTRPVVPTISKFNRNETKLNNQFGTTTKSVGIRPPQLRSPADKTTGNVAKESGTKLKNVVVQDISAFLPPGYDVEKVKSEPTEKSLLDDILSKAKVDISSFLPPDYVAKQGATSDQKKNDKPPAEDIFKKSQIDIASFLPPGYDPKLINEDTANASSKQPRIDDLFTASKIDIASLLPPGYDPKKIADSSDESGSKNETQKKVTIQENFTTEATVSTTKAGGLKIVFPSRPGGRKAISRPTTPSSAQGHARGGFKPVIRKGAPARATTEFTGWPTSSTTPISIEKLLEAARTATAQSDNMSSTPIASMTTSTTTTTTTTTTPRPTTPGICEEECEVAGTIRLVGNTAWVPELLDSNTVEWKELANEVEKEVDFVFAKSSTLRKWYKKIKIDAFSRVHSEGSILVDYFVELNEIGKKVNTQELKSMFHESLTAYVADNDNSTVFDNLLILGAFTIDPSSTDFVVVPRSSIPSPIDNENTIMPQWAIAVIVIGVGGLLFIIVFGVSVLINRQNVAKIKPTMPIFDEEIEKNIIHKNQMSPRRRSLDYPKEDLYNIDADWNDKSFDSTSNKMMVDGPYDSSRYNLYDSWRSEWNGYYQNASRSSNRSPGYESTSHISHRHHPDYDTNF